MKTIVIYHNADFDGIFCREIAKKFIPDAELIGWNFGDQPVKFDPSTKVYILDLPVDAVLGLERGAGFLVYEKAPNIVWIDHHKSSIESHDKTIPGYRIDGVAACRLAWHWFSTDHTDVVVQFNGLSEKQDFIDRKVSEPLAVRLAGEYDIWDKRDPNADLFQHGLRSQDLTDAIWILMLSEVGHHIVDTLLKAGKCIQYAKANEDSSIINSYGFDIEFEGLKFLACNHARFNSHLFTAGIRPDHDALFGFKWDGKQWNVSLYGIDGRPEIDLSLIAVKYGGGGHKGACGFRTKSLPFLT